MRLPCPICGKRPAAEFSYGGAAVPRPEPDASVQAWDDYVYLRDNRAGAHAELWFHAAGCHRWFTLLRDTRTDVPLPEDVG